MASIRSTHSDGPLLAVMVSRTIPKLTYDMHKGSCGRIGVIGGSKEYVQIFCRQATEVVLKGHLFFFLKTSDLWLMP